MTKPTTTYMICTTARSGSNLLCDYLSNAGLFGSPWEFFNPDTIRHGHLGKKFSCDETLSVSAYIDWLTDNFTSSNGVFGVKVLYNDFEAFRGFPAFQELFLKSRKIHLSRKSKAKQALSYHFARYTGQWIASDPAKMDSEAVPFEYHSILEHLESLIYQDTNWQMILNASDADPHFIVHENFIRDPAYSLAEVAKWLAIPESYQIKTTLIEQKTFRTDEFLKKFYANFMKNEFADIHEGYIGDLQLLG